MPSELQHNQDCITVSQNGDVVTVKQKAGTTLQTGYEGDDILGTDDGDSFVRNRTIVVLDLNINSGSGVWYTDDLPERNSDAYVVGNASNSTKTQELYGLDENHCIVYLKADRLGNEYTKTLVYDSYTYGRKTITINWVKE